MRFLGVLLLTISFLTPAWAQDPLFREFAPPVEVSAVAVVVHGLNTRPTRMLPIVEFLNSNGVYVLNVSLSGHRFGTEMEDVSAGLWKREMQEAFEAAKLRSLHFGVPLNFVAYSLGALAGMRALQELPKGFIDQAVLLAPAISLTKKTHLIRALAPFRKFVVPSLSPLSYRANWGTSVTCYNSLFKLRAELYKNSWTNFDFKTLVIMDPQDELVNWKGVNKIALKNWRIMPIDNSNGDARTYHHLILDEWALGKSEWERMTGAMLSGLALKAKKNASAEAADAPKVD